MLLNVVIRQSECDALLDQIKEADGKIVSVSNWGINSRFLIVSVSNETYTFLKIKYGEKIWPR